MPLLGDIKVNEDTHPPGTPLKDIYDFWIWDGGKWVHGNTASNTVYYACMRELRGKDVKDHPVIRRTDMDT